MHQSFEAVIVIDRIMQDLSVVPECDGVRPPPETARKLQSDLVLVEVVEQRSALLHCPAVEPFGMCNIDVQALLASFGVRTHSWMIGNSILLLATRVFHPVFTSFARICFCG